MVPLSVLDELHDLEGVGGGVVQLTHAEHEAALVSLVHPLHALVKLKTILSMKTNHYIRAELTNFCPAY